MDIVKNASYVFVSDTKPKVSATMQIITISQGWMSRFEQDFTNLEEEVSQNFAKLETDIENDVTQFKEETKEDFTNFKEEVKKNIDQEQVVKNTNKITAIENALISKGTIAKREGTLTEEIQQTGGAKLEGLTVLDGSYATVKKIQGKTVASKNLIDIPPYFFKGGENVQGEIVWSGASIYTRHGMTFSYKCSDGITPQVAPIFKFTFADGSVIEDSGTFTTTFDANKTLVEIRIMNYPDHTTGKVYDIMLNTGSTALPYQPFFTGLKHAQISGIKSIGRNLFNPNRTVADFGAVSASTVRNFIPNSIIKGVSYTNSYATSTIPNFSYENEKLSFSSNDIRYGIGFNFDCKSGEKYVFSCAVSSTGSIAMYVVFYQNGSWVKYVTPSSNRSFTVPNDCNQMVILLCNSVANEAIEITDLQLEYGEISNDYEPYTESVMTLPETAELKEWDYIENGKLVKQTGTVQLEGTENWIIDTDGYYYTVWTSDLWADQVDVPKCVTQLDKTFYITGGYIIRAYVQDMFTLDEWEAYLIEQNSKDTPFTVAYKLATPTETPIFADLEYQVWDKGREQMQLENTDAIPTIDNEYIILLGGAE